MLHPEIRTIRHPVQEQSGETHLQFGSRPGNDIAPTVLAVQSGADPGKQLKAHAPEVFLVLGFVNPDVLTTLESNGRPVVLIDLYAPGFSSVNSDNALGGWLAMQHPLDPGRQIVAFIGGSLAPYSIAQRPIVYRRTFHETSRMFNPVFVASLPLGVDVEAGQGNAMEALLDSVKPDAVFAYKDVAALAVMKVCPAMGRRIPEDVAFAGFVDIAIAANSTPPLTTIALDKFDLGQQGAQLMINGVDTVIASLLPVRLVVRAVPLRQGETLPRGLMTPASDWSEIFVLFLDKLAVEKNKRNDQLAGLAVRIVPALLAVNEA